MRFKIWIILILKGIGMGAANVIPGVSGGTVALITNIFEKLIHSIKSFDLKAIKLLFQGRFKAILIDADEYLKHLSRYIHLNPVRAKIVAIPSKYQWSSYAAFTGKLKTPPFLETEWLLSNFGKRKKEARRNYKAFVEAADITTLENPHKQLSAGFILGDLDFVNWIKETFLSGRKDEKEIPQLKKLKPKTQLETSASNRLPALPAARKLPRLRGANRPAGR